MESVNFLEEEPKVMGGIVLKELSEKVTKLIQKRKDINFAEDKLKEIKKEEEELSRQAIPQLLLSCGLSSISLSSGEKIEIIEKLTVSIPKKDEENRKKVMKWLIKIGGANLIKQELKVEEPEQSIINFLQKEGIPFMNLHSVNARSFTAFLNAKLGMKKGSLQELELADIPKEVNPFVYKETKIKE